jgi:hypothetical protein
MSAALKVKKTGEVLGERKRAYVYTLKRVGALRRGTDLRL